MKNRFRSTITAAAALTAAALVTPCLAPVPAHASAQSDPYGIWTGTLVTEQGTCPDQTESILQIAPKRLAFAPGTGTLQLHGTPVKGNARFHAQLMLQDKDKKPLPMVFEGHPDGDTITGTFGTPSCRAHITLKRPAGHAWQNFMGD